MCSDGVGNVTDVDRVQMFVVGRQFNENLKKSATRLNIKLLFLTIQAEFTFPLFLPFSFRRFYGKCRGNFSPAVVPKQQRFESRKGYSGGDLGNIKGKSELWGTGALLEKGNQGRHGNIWDKGVLRGRRS